MFSVDVSMNHPSMKSTRTNSTDEETEAAYVVGIETALFTREDVLLDSQASVNIFSNENLLHDIGVAK